MGLFDRFKRSAKPYQDEGLNLIYELLFCDNIDLFKKNSQEPHEYPWDILFSDKPQLNDLARILADKRVDARTRALAYNRLSSTGQKPTKKELLGTIVEVGMDNGPDVLAAYGDGTARYINHSEKIIIREDRDETSTKLIDDLLIRSADVVTKIGPWDKARVPFPGKGVVRLTFLVSDGLYFGQGPFDIISNDAMGGPVLAAASQLMKYLTETAMSKS